MYRPILAASALALCALSVGCSRHTDEPAPQSNSQVAVSTSASTSAQEAPGASDSPQAPGDETKRIRRAIREFIAEKYPNSEVEGVWSLGSHTNYCFAGADTVINGRHRNIDVLVRQYVRDDGSQYWRGEGFGPDTARLLRSDTALTGTSDSNGNSSDAD